MCAAKQENFIKKGNFIAFDEGERITNRVLGVLCLTGRKIPLFCHGSVGGSVVDASLAPSKIFAGAARSARNWYGLRPRFHDAQVPNGQSHECRRIWILVEMFCLFSSSFLETFSSLQTRHSLKFIYKHKQRT